MSERGQQLSGLLKAIGVSVSQDVCSLDPMVWRVTSDSRQSGEGTIFVAIRGARADGHHYLASAWRAGAAALVVEAGTVLPEAIDAATIPCVEVADTRVALAHMAALLYGPLPEPLGARVVGLTGTNGKTSTSYLLESIFRAAEGHPGIIGTINYRVDEQIWPAPLTTPPPELLWQTFGRMAEHGATHIVMEVSSHALDQKRVDGIPFQVAGFTNLTQDHLDYHGSLEAYFAAKALLFSARLVRGGRGVVNLDDAMGARLVEVSQAPCWTYSTDPESGADIVALSHDIGRHGIRASVRTPKGALAIESPLLGAFHLHNLLLSCGVALALDVPLAAIEAGIKALPAIPGRLEQVPHAHASSYQVLVDYAHTPDALEQILKSVRPLCPGRLIVAFGCGGDRDVQKRPLMGEAVASKADICIVTSDNPRTEDPQQIIDQIVAGVTPHQDSIEPGADVSKGYWCCLDRREAILQAIAMAQPDDMVLIAGKGHEDYQIIGETRYPFSDRSIAMKALREKAAPGQEGAS